MPSPPMPSPAQMLPTDTSWIKRQFCDIPYGPEKAQKLNVYLPQDGAGPFPVVFFVHGGAFSGGNRTDPQLKPYLELIKYGMALVSVDYRLSGEVVFPQGIQDCNRALRFVCENGGQWNLDTERIALLGNSSGANFVLMMCAGVDEPFLYDGDAAPVPVKCCVTWFAPTEFLSMDSAFLEDGEEGTPGMKDAAIHSEPFSPESVYLGGPLLELDPAYVRCADPISYITPQLPPILMQHGRMDHIVHWSQSRIFADKAEQVCGKGRVTLEILPNADHADPAFETEENMKRVATFLQEHLGIET